MHTRAWRWLVLLFLISIATHSAGFSNQKYKTENQEIMLSGKLTLETYLDANDEPEKSFILYSDKAIGVLEDKFGGPSSNVKKIQLVLMEKKDIAKAKNLINKKIRVVGTLFYGFSAHHHTDVLITVMKIEGL